MPAINFRAKLLLLVGALLTFTLLTTFISVLMTTARNIEQNARHELAVGGGVIHQLLAQRAAQLRDSVKVLTADFGFKGAVATGDQATIQSALMNHGARINANLMMLIAPEGDVTASALDDADGADPPASMQSLSSLRSLFERARARSTDTPAAVVAVQGRPYQVVLAPINAPDLIAWALIGFSIDRALAEDLKDITDLDVSFLVGRDVATSTLIEADRALLSERLRPPARTAAAAHDGGVSGVDTLRLAGDDYLTLTLLLSGTAGAADSVCGALQVSLTKAMRPYAGLRTELMARALVTLLFGLATAALLAGRVARPVNQLAEAASRIRQGDYAQQVPVTGSDELAALASAFNAMQKGIAERETRILRHAYYDELTGLPNRTLALDRLGAALRFCQRESDYPLSLVVINLDRFRQINDVLGHAVGDRVLCEVGARLSARMRQADSIARLEGDEFLLLLNGASLPAATKLAGEVVRQLSEPIVWQDINIQLSVRCGVAAYPQHGDTDSELLRRADIALHDAKERRRTVGVYQTGRDESHLRQIELMSELQLALEENQLELYYQPKLHLAEQRVIGAEALIRWHHPQHGFIPPDEFIPPAEQSGHIRLLTRWVIERAARQARVWLDRGFDLRVAVNLSAVDLLDEQLPDYVERQLRCCALPASQLALEVTESAVMRDPERALAVLDELKARGTPLAIDDVGTGYASLAQHAAGDR